MSRNLPRLLVMASVPFLALLILPLSVAGFQFGHVEKSWSQTLSVPAGEGTPVFGRLQREGGGILVYGSIIVRSCCGLSTHDIGFTISGITSGRDFGTVVGNLTFEHDTGIDDSYWMSFDNTWGRNASSPSYHDKTGSVNVREIAPNLFELAGWSLVSIVITGGVAAVASISTGILLVRRMRRRNSDSASHLDEKSSSGCPKEWTGNMKTREV